MTTTLQDRVIWLQERSALSDLDEATLTALSERMEVRRIAPHREVIVADTPPEGLFILETGRLEHKPGVSRPMSFLPGSVLNLRSLLLGESVEKTILTLSECRFGFIPAESFQQVKAQHPEIMQVFSQQIAAELRQIASQLTYEQERQDILRPYLVTKARRGVIGRSRYANRLRQQIRDAFKACDDDCGSVLVFGEPGTEKDNIAALIHYSSIYRRQPIIKVDCARLQTSGAELFGRVGGKPGLLEALGQGTLILNNVEELPKELMGVIAHLLTHHTYCPISRNDAEPAIEQTSTAHFILIAERPVSALSAAVDTQIKVPPLRVRKADIEDYVNYYISLISRARGQKRILVTPEAIRRLQAYDFPNNLRELESLVSRALSQAAPGCVLTEEILWPSQSKKKQFRLNLLNAYPKLRHFLRSPWWPDRINYGFTLTAFAFFNALLFIGPQTRDQNIALNLFWAWWWPVILLIFPFLGRVWCAVCPFMIYGEALQTLSLKLFPRQLKRWPRQAAERWGGWFLFGLFALILLWEELWDLENTAYLSSCLLLLITAGAVIFSQIFERRFWCRYLCPIGGMNGLYAKLSMTELRAQQGTCSAECTTYQCYKGGPAKGEGQETDGCPLYSHPAQLEDNRDCVLCMTCLKACPHRSVEVNLRPPGIELWTTHTPRIYEVALLLLLLDAVFLHRLPELLNKLSWSVDPNIFGVHGGLAIALLSLPALIPLAAHALLHAIQKAVSTRQPRPFVELAYGYLPLVLMGTLAHYLRLFLTEAGRVLPISAATIGLSGTSLPVVVAHPAVIAFLQGTSLMVGAVLAIALTQKIARYPLRLMVPQHGAIMALTAGLWWLIV
ncbi:sigma 54-interacting transcriptional regulator [Oscillatoria sp. CS-180]|nr:sigma 54-interacting transcriptional regulator [Oscillatoria sp. CS-180]MDB9529165.1 sigma 54-interacting transcriptional regulator [Oscillatoria sp. CS-180]